MSQNDFEIYIRKKISFIIAGEIDDIKYNTKEKIDIDKEYVSFFTYLSD